jgi:hypothetical protein
VEVTGVLVAGVEFASDAELAAAHKGPGGDDMSDDVRGAGDAESGWNVWTSGGRVGAFPYTILLPGTEAQTHIPKSNTTILDL